MTQDFRDPVHDINGRKSVWQFTLTPHLSCVLSLLSFYVRCRLCFSFQWRVPARLPGWRLTVYPGHMM